MDLSKVPAKAGYLALIVISIIFILISTVAFLSGHRHSIIFIVVFSLLLVISLIDYFIRQKT